MSIAVFSKPRFWFILGIVSVIIGITLFSLSIVAKTAVLPSVKRGLNNMRYIDTLEDSESCDALIVGDIGCSSKRLEAWSMASNEKENVCLSSDDPSSKALTAASRWCSDGEPGCGDKKLLCKQGEKNVFHFFSVLNPVDVLNGSNAELQEMDPIRITKATDKINIDTSDLESLGTIQYEEASRYTLTDAADERLLDQVVVMPNPTIFAAAFNGHGDRVSGEAITYVMAAGLFYHGFQAKINAMTSSVAVRQWFSGHTAVNLDTISVDQFRAASFTLALGELFASPACPLLLPVMAAGLNSPFPTEIVVKLMCHDGYRGNVGFSALSPLLAASKVSFSPRDAPFFFEYEKGCMEKSDKHSNACFLSTICPYPVGSQEYDACVKPTLTEPYTRSLFHLFKTWSEEPRVAPMYVRDFLIRGCSAGSESVSGEVCDQLVQQLLRVGRASYTVNNPKWREMREAYGWDLDNDMANKLIPYFFNGTVRALTGIGNTKPAKTPEGTKRGLQLWVDSLYPNGTTTDFTNGPYSLAVTSNAAPGTGMEFRTTAVLSNDKMTQACTFDYGCMLSHEYQSRGKCVHVPGQCEPEQVEGQSAGFTYPRLFEDRWRDPRQTIFDPENFVKATFERAGIDQRWGALRVDTWNLTDIGFKTHNCDNLATGTSRGVDCDSPKGTKNIGYHLAEKVMKELNARSAYVPFYLSFPWFTRQVPATVKGVYDPRSKVNIRPCPSCPAVRDFGSRLYTEPETGTHVHGSSKIQLNIRLHSNIAQASRLPGTRGKDLRALSSVIPSDVDILIPLFWMDRYDSAAPYQAAKLAAIQSLPRTINIIFGLLLGFGLLLMASGAVMIRRGFTLKNNYKKLLASRDSMKTSETGSNEPVPRDADRIAV